MSRGLQPPFSSRVAESNIRRAVNGRPHWYAIRSGVAGLAESLDGDGVRFIPMSRPVRSDTRLTDFIVREKYL
jgi:hypothetical protein